MPNRVFPIAAIFLPAVAIGAAATVAPAAGPCLTGPDKEPPPGHHWFYRTDHATQKKCWHLGDENGVVVTAPTESKSEAATAAKEAPRRPASRPAPRVAASQRSASNAYDEWMPHEQAQRDQPRPALGYADADPPRTLVAAPAPTPARADAVQATTRLATRWPDPAPAVAADKAIAVVTNPVHVSTATVHEAPAADAPPAPAPAVMPVDDPQPVAKQSELSAFFGDLVFGLCAGLLGFVVMAAGWAMMRFVRAGRARRAQERQDEIEHEAVGRAASAADAHDSPWAGAAGDAYIPAPAKAQPEPIGAMRAVPMSFFASAATRRPEPRPAPRPAAPPHRNLDAEIAEIERLLALARQLGGVESPPFDIAEGVRHPHE